MSLLQLKNQIKELKQAIEPEPTALVIIYDRKQREGNEIDLEAIVEIGGKDVTGLSNAVKEEILSKSHIHFYLPAKDPYPECNSNAQND
jgi:hypothetical protein